MVSTKLMATLSKTLPENIKNTIKLCFNESKLDANQLEELKNIFQTSSNRRVIELVLFAVALSELEAQASILDFPAYDYIQKIETLLGKASFANNLEIFPPIWVVIATAKIVKKKYNLFEFDTVE